MITYLKIMLESAKELCRLLFQSVSSVDFYKNVYLNFSGYGFRFIFIITYISSLVVTLFMLDRAQSVKEYFATKVVSNYETRIIDTILSEWQIFYYNGTNIISDESEPILIQVRNKQVLVAIDANDSLTGLSRKNIPIVFGKTKLLVGISDNMSDNSVIPIEYSDIFGKTNKTIVVDTDLLRMLGIKYIDQLKRLLIYMFFPGCVIVSLITLFIEQGFMIILIYFASKMFIDKESTISSAVRLVVFSCGAYALILPLSLIRSEYAGLLQMLHLWTTGLMIIALSQLATTPKSKVR